MFLQSPQRCLVGLSAMSPNCWKSKLGPVVPKTEIFTLLPCVKHWCPPHGWLCFSCPLFLRPSVVCLGRCSARSRWVCVSLLTLPLSSGLDPICGSYNFCLLCLPGFSLPHPETLSPQPVESHLAQPAVSACPFLTWVFSPGPLPFTCSLTSHAIRPSHLHPACLPALSCHRRTSSHQQ